MSQQFIGVWKLISIQFHRGDQITRFWDDNPQGYLMYLPNGYMSVQLMPDQRRNYASGDPFHGTQEEHTETATNFMAYCGTYSIQNTTVTHHVVVSSFPNYIGQQLVRQYAFSDGTLTLSTPPMMLEGEEQTAQLVWRKVD
jgi:hypothetical protein